MSPSRAAKNTKKIHWLSLLQFAGSAYGLVFFWASAAAAAFYSLYQYSLTPEDAEAIPDVLLSAAGMFWVGLLLIPPIAYGLARLLNKKVPNVQVAPQLQKFFSLLLVLGFPVAILAGALLLESDSQFLLSPFHVIAATLSVGWLLWVAIRKLDLGSLQRRWGAFASGLTAGPIVAVLLEFSAGLLLLVVAIFYITLNPQLFETLQNLQRGNLSNSPEVSLSFLYRLLDDPVLLALVLANFSLFVPLIEELAKPMAVWILMWRTKLTPAQGFGLGMLSGAGFALFENLFSAAVTDWTNTTLVRIGATAFHLATAGLMGWALVSAKNERRYLRLFGVYIFNITLHGIWNGVVVINSISSLDRTAQNGSLPLQLPLISASILLLITIISISILALMNRRFRLQPATARKIARKSVPRKTLRSRSS